MISRYPLEDSRLYQIILSRGAGLEVLFGTTTSRDCAGSALQIKWQDPIAEKWGAPMMPESMKALWTVTTPPLTFTLDIPVQMPTTTIRHKIQKTKRNWWKSATKAAQGTGLESFTVYFGNYLGVWPANDWASLGTSFISLGEGGPLLFSRYLGFY